MGDLKPARIVVDSIHGAVELTETECNVIDTASFQRLRHLKQLGLGHATYPNATHTRFAHSVGVLAVMSRVLRAAAAALKLDDERQQDLRLAALLHDIGHYPYSHLMERLGNVVLTEDRVPRNGKRKAIASTSPYPDHEEVGRIIVTTQEDVIEAIGDKERAEGVADLFTRGEAAEPQLSKLIHSSLDMDRLDYLLRDARAAGVPHGEIDVNYLLNNVRTSSTGMIGVKYKALHAAEQFLLARYFMYRTVYYHKTTFALEETFRQLLRRCRDAGKYGVPADGKAVRAIARDASKLLEFTDHLPDQIARAAMQDGDSTIAALAKAVVFRRPPKLLREECTLVDTGDDQHRKHNACTTFLRSCEERLPRLAKEHGLPLGLFLIAEPPRVGLEKRGRLIRAAEVAGQPSEKRDELMKVFVQDEEEPKSLVDISESLISHCAHLVARIVRLYVVEPDAAKVQKLRQAVSDW